MKWSSIAIGLWVSCLAYAADHADNPRPDKVEFTEGKKHYVLTLQFTGPDKQAITGFRITTPDGMLIQEIPHEFDLSEMSSGYLPVSVQDCDFDGFDDLKLAHDGFTGSASKNQTYAYWVWDKSQGRFVFQKQLTELGIRDIDPKSGYLEAFGNSGGGLWSRHVYEFTPDGKIIPVYSEGTSRDAQGGVSLEKKFYKNGRLQKTVDGVDPN